MSDISSNLRSFFTDKVRTYNSIYIVNGFLEKLFSLKAIPPQLRSPWNGGFPASAVPTNSLIKKRVEMLQCTHNRILAKSIVFHPLLAKNSIRLTQKKPTSPP